MSLSDRAQLVMNYMPRISGSLRRFSPSNTRTEIELKLRRYQEAPANLYALVIEPREFLVEIHARSRNWDPMIFRQREDPIEMPELGLRSSVVDLYRGTPLAPGRAG